ncbi:hypothetical protein B0H14DRAFT_3475264 [Mycena olivaceomarginata]|nr:hypothetical protein B0H14DRAFT_3475264 [Mycena olivaceomarginata]
MATRIVLDPGLDICPDYTSAAFQLIRTALIAQTAGSTDTDAATQLTAAWNTDWDARKVAWATQIQADADDAEQERLDREALEAAERKETDKKKPKLATFDASQSVPDSSRGKCVPGVAHPAVRCRAAYNHTDMAGG